MIEFEEAGFSYGRTAVLRDVTLTLAPGSFHFLIGPSGAGKTTLLRLCYLDLVADRGARSASSAAPIAPRDRNAIADLRRAVGVVHQDCRFLDHLPLIENIALPLRVSGIDARRTGPTTCEALLEWVDLGRPGRGAAAGALGRRAAAGGAGAGGDPEPGGDPRRRADRQRRLGDGAAAADAARRAQPHGQDRAGRHPRPEPDPRRRGAGAGAGAAPRRRAGAAAPEADA